MVGVAVDGIGVGVMVGVAVGVAPLRQAVDQGLGHILDDREASRHVAIYGCVAGGHLALVAGS